MRRITVKKIGRCPQCFRNKLSVLTNSPLNSEFNNGDVVACNNCGTEGVIKHTEWNDCYVNWSMRFKPTLSDIVAEVSKISDLFTNANLDKYLSEVREAKARSTNEEHTNFLVKVESALLLLKEANSKETP